MHFIVAFLNLVYRLANTFSPGHSKVDLFKKIVQNMQQVQNFKLFENKRKVQKNLRLVLFLAFLYLGYSIAAVAIDAEILDHGVVYVMAKLAFSLVHQLMLVSEMVLYWALTLSAATQLDACGRNLRKRVAPRAAHFRFCLWKILQVIGDVDEAFGPMLLLVLTSRNIYIQMDVYNVLQNLIAYSDEGNKLHAAAVCLLWTLLDLITIFMMLFPAIHILRKVRGINKCILRLQLPTRSWKSCYAELKITAGFQVGILIDEFSRLLNAKNVDYKTKLDVSVKKDFFLALLCTDLIILYADVIRAERCHFLRFKNHSIFFLHPQYRANLCCTI